MTALAALPGTGTQRVHRRAATRTTIVTASLVVALAAAFCVTISVGDFPIPLRDVVPAIFGAGNEQSEFIVRTLRLPRAITAILVGAAFGISGAIFQSIARNPLASPDIIGIDAGASAAAVFCIVVLHSSTTGTAAGALGGSLVAALLIYVLAWKDGVSPYRLVLIGIGLAAMLVAATQYLLTRAQIFEAQRAVVWLTGSLNGRSWSDVRTIGIAMIILVPIVATLSGRLRVMQLGDDAAKGLGVPVERSRLSLVIAAVALAAMATAAAGPIIFVAFVANPIARRLTRSPLALVVAALVGALIMLLSDLVARRLFAPTELPVGVITGVVGAPYLLWLLARSNKVGAEVATTNGDQPTLAADGLSLAYDDREVVADLSVTIPSGQITVIVGPNACGKSTLLRALGRLLKPRRGAVLLDGTSIHKLPTREVATRLGILPQSPVAPEGITVADLVGRGRYPHQGWFRQWTPADRAAVDDALAATGTLDLAGRPVDELSGGQRQRVWIAMTLAQGTSLMLLDEPTTFLDMAHQVEVLDLLVDLNQQEGRTIVLVLHDLNHACRYAHHLVAIRDGAIVAEGPPDGIVTPELITDVFGLACQVIEDPVSRTPLVVPVGRHLHVSAERTRLTG